MDIPLDQMRQQARRLADTAQDVDVVEVSTPSGERVYGSAFLSLAVARFVAVTDAQAA